MKNLERLQLELIGFLLCSLIRDQITLKGLAKAKPSSY